MVGKRLKGFAHNSVFHFAGAGLSIPEIARYCPIWLGEGAEKDFIARYGQRAATYYQLNFQHDPSQCSASGTGVG